MAKSQKTKNYQAHEEWMVAKKFGRKKQVWVPATFVEHTGQPVDGHWEKI